MGQRVIWYTDYTTDVVTTAGQSRPLAADFSWTRSGRLVHWLDPLVTFGARRFGTWYWRHRLHATVRGAEKLVPYAEAGLFLYANHTQPVGDPFLPLWLLPHTPVRTLAAPANLTLPVIGRLLPAGGALIVPDRRAQMRPFLAAVTAAHAAGTPVAVFPEAHVWPAYTGIRPFVAGSFHYPVALHAPSFTATVTYQQTGCTVFVDGPFWPATGMRPKAQQAALAATVQAAMQAHAAANVAERIIYRRREA